MVQSDRKDGGDGMQHDQKNNTGVNQLPMTHLWELQFVYHLKI